MKPEKKLIPFGVNSKKGIAMVLEIIFVLIIFIVLAIVAIFGHSVYKELSDDIQSDEEMADIAKQSNTKLFSNYSSLLDNLFMFVFVFLVVFLLVGAYMLDEQPIFFVIGLIVFIFILIAAMSLANTFDDIASDSAMATSANQYVFIGWIMSHLLEVLISIGFLLIIVLYMKFRG